MKENTDGATMGAPGPSGFGGVFGNCRGFVRGRFAGSLSSGDAHVAEIVDVIKAIELAL